MKRKSIEERPKLLGFPGLPSTPQVPGIRFPDLRDNPEPQATRDYLRPTYTARFGCIASACEDTCCKGWSVPIDRGTYEKYRSIEAMKPHLGTLIVLNTNQPTTADYARIAMTGDSTCAFLDAERLCGVQKQFGAEALSVTCATYPRAVLDTVGEEALNLSCPEAARVTLLEADLLNESAWRAPDAGRYAGVRYAAAGGRPTQPRLAIREFALLLLADRGYPLWQRMYLLGILTRRLQALSHGTSLGAWADGNPKAVTRLLVDSARIASVGTLRQTMDESEARPAEQLQLVMEMLRTRLSQQPIPPRFLECVKDFEAGLGCATAKSEQEILAAYSDSYRLYYGPFMERHPHVLENYLANSVFKNRYPFGRKAEESSEGEHLMLCAHLGLIQTLLVGMAGHYRETFDAGHVVKLVQSFARTFEHSKESGEQIRELVREKNLNNSRGIALLLRLA